MIFEGSLTHLEQILIYEILILSLFEHFKVTGAILPPHTEAILQPLRNGTRASFLVRFENGLGMRDTF